jgi:myosin-crossreactive antigen
MCQIETNDPNHGWRVECTFPASSQPKANLKATRVIVKDLWEDLYLDIPEDDNDIIDKLAYTEKQKFSDKFVTDFHNEDQFFENIRVTIWETILA